MGHSNSTRRHEPARHPVQLLRPCPYRVGGRPRGLPLPGILPAQIRNANTRRAYAKAVGEFCAWLEGHGLPSIVAVSSIHIAAYVEELGRSHSVPTVKQRLAAIRMMFDWLATGGVLPFNPASAVRGPKHVVNRVKTPVLAPDEARAILDAVNVSTPIGLRDRALIGLMVYTSPGSARPPPCGSRTCLCRTAACGAAA